MSSQNNSAKSQYKGIEESRDVKISSKERIEPSKRNIMNVNQKRGNKAGVVKLKVEERIEELSKSTKNNTKAIYNVRSDLTNTKISIYGELDSMRNLDFSKVSSENHSKLIRQIREEMCENNELIRKEIIQSVSESLRNEIKKNKDDFEREILNLRHEVNRNRTDISKNSESIEKLETLQKSILQEVREMKEEMRNLLLPEYIQYPGVRYLPVNIIGTEIQPQTHQQIGVRSSSSQQQQQQQQVYPNIHREDQVQYHQHPHYENQTHHHPRQPQQLQMYQESVVSSAHIQQQQQFPQNLEYIPPPQQEQTKTRKQIHPSTNVLPSPQQLYVSPVVKKIDSVGHVSNINSSTSASKESKHHEEAEDNMTTNGTPKDCGIEGEKEIRRSSRRRTPEKERHESEEPKTHSEEPQKIDETSSTSSPFERREVNTGTIIEDHEKQEIISNFKNDENASTTSTDRPVDQQQRKESERKKRRTLERIGEEGKRKLEEEMIRIEKELEEKFKNRHQFPSQIDKRSGGNLTHNHNNSYEDLKKPSQKQHQSSTNKRKRRRGKKNKSKGKGGRGGKGKGKGKTHQRSRMTKEEEDRLFEELKRDNLKREEKIVQMKKVDEARKLAVMKKQYKESEEFNRKKEGEIVKLRKRGEAHVENITKKMDYVRNLFPINDSKNETENWKGMKRTLQGMKPFQMDVGEGDTTSTTTDSSQMKMPLSLKEIQKAYENDGEGGSDEKNKKEKRKK